MSQTFDSSLASADSYGTAVKTTLPANDLALLSLHSGSTAPTFTVAYMLWADTSAGLLRQRNASNDGWVALGPLLGSLASHAETIGEGISLSTTRRWFWVAPRDVTIERIVIVADVSTTSSSGNEWQVEIDNLTQAADLLSATVGTHSTDGGIGGGELVGDAAAAFVPDQNQAIDADDVVEIGLVAVGTVTTLDRVAIRIEYRDS